MHTRRNYALIRAVNKKENNSENSNILKELENDFRENKPKINYKYEVWGANQSITFESDMCFLLSADTAAEMAGVLFD